MICLPMPPSGVPPAPLTVSGRDLKSLALRLQEAEWLLFTGQPATEAARAFVSILTDAVLAQEARKRPRGAKERAALYEAVGAVAGGVLLPALKHGRMVHAGLGEHEFTGGPVGYAPAMAALRGLVALGFVIQHASRRFQREVPFGEGIESAGLHSRFEAAASLLDLAAAYGITAETVRAQFTVRYRDKAEPADALITLRAFKASRGTALDTLLPFNSRDPAFRRLRDDVKLANRTLAAVRWDGCQPPRVYRAFRGDWAHGGRWITTGRPPLQHLSPAARLDVRINGGAAAEVDVRGSQLSILAARAGAPSLPGDPYQTGPLSAFARHDVKAAVMAALGSGRLRTKWPKSMGGQHTTSMKALSEALAAAHPYLVDVAEQLNVPAARSALRLQSIEAECLTGALVPLWESGVPAVPIHDGVLVPGHAAADAEAALRASYRTVTGAAITTTTRRAETQ